MAHVRSSISAMQVLDGHIDDDRQVEIDQDTERMPVLLIKDEATITDTTMINTELE